MGVPIPGFSISGLGKALVDLGIPKGYLSINLLDAGLGILAVADGYSNLTAALSGNLHWSTGTFFDTFGSGTIELVFGYATENPLMLIAGCENYIAGFKSLYDYTVTSSILGVPIDSLLSSFGIGFGFGIVLGFVFSNNLTITERTKKALIAGVESGSFSLLFTLHPLIGITAAITLQAICFSKKLAQNDKNMELYRHLYHLKYNEFLSLIKSYTEMPAGFRPLYVFYDENQDSLIEKHDTNDPKQNLIFYSKIK